MKVYILMGGIDWEGESFVAVYGSEVDAYEAKTALELKKEYDYVNVYAEDVL